MSAILREQFEKMQPNMVSCVRHIQRGAFFDKLSGSKTFFGGASFMQKGAGRHNIDKAVANTFAIFMLQKNSYTLEAKLELHEEKSYKLRI
ncbi:MAG: hypothetical protein AB7G20_00880 [Sulfurimonas sp.]|jgi:hypothetical protein|uniref:hypothetical protein n=1 Tax=Sulfurimonas sp. TaxID=2022749 RepID=UPI003D101E5F